MICARITCPVLAAALLLPPGASGRAAAKEETIDFARQVQPIFARVCLGCHGPQKQRGGLRLDVREHVFKGGDSGTAAVKPGDPAAGTLLKRITSAEKSLRMPPQGERLPETEIAVLRRWIAAGAPGPTRRTSHRRRANRGRSS